MKENIEEVIEFLQGFNDGYTFQQCQTCFKFNEKDGCCNKEKCEELEAINFLISDYKRVLKENEELKSDNLEYQRTQDIFDERKYRKKYLEERRSEQPKLLYPDADEIYERYYKLKEENKELKKELGRVTSGRNQLFEYATAQQVNPEMLHKVLRVEYIPKQKVKDKIEEYKRDVINLDTYPNFSEQELHREIINILQDLLEEKGE